MTMRLHDVTQGSDEWLALRCGLLTASEIKRIVTPAQRKPAANDKQRAHLYELAAQRLTGYVEPSFVSDAMLAGYDGEILAREIYAQRFAPVRQVGFITNDKWGFTLGYSPDGLVGENGQIEIKSRAQQFQVQAIVERLPAQTIPAEHVIQVQAGLLVSGRAWCDYISYCPGLPMSVVRVTPDDDVQKAIIFAAAAFERLLQEALDAYAAVLRNPAHRWASTERVALGDIAA